MLIAHIIFALSSFPLMLGAAANEFFGFISNSRILPLASAGTFAGMVATGTVLVITTHHGLLGPCIMGLAYLASLSIVYLSAKYIAKKFVKETN